jgi:hypothetical protein
MGRRNPARPGLRRRPWRCAHRTRRRARKSSDSTASRVIRRTARDPKQVGTPDYTAADSPLKRPDAELLAVIANGKSETEGKMMPPFGNVLSPQAIHDVLAYLREAFLKQNFNSGVGGEKNLRDLDSQEDAERL